MADLYHLEDEIVDNDAVQEVEQQEDQENNTDWENEEAEHVQLVVDKDDLVGTNTAPAEPTLEWNDVQQQDGGDKNTVNHRLYLLWSQEKQSPELLPYNEETIVELRQLFLEEPVIDTGDDNLDALLISMQTIDSQRLKYLLSSLLKTRLNKIEKYYKHMGTQQDNMSEYEVTYWKSYSELVESHLETTVTSHFTNDDFKALDAVHEPDLDQFVTLKTNQAIEMNERAFESDSVLIARYRKVQEFFLSGQVELL